MSAITVEAIRRVFKYNGATLPDPNPKLDINGVRGLYANQYPELASADVSSKIVGNRQVITFQKVVEYKG